LFFPPICRFVAIGLINYYFTFVFLITNLSFPRGCPKSGVFPSVGMSVALTTNGQKGAIDKVKDDEDWTIEMDHPGHHPRWDAGGEDWSNAHRKSAVFGGDSGRYIVKSGFGEREFSKAVEDEPLLDEDAVRLNAAGFDVNYATHPFISCSWVSWTLTFSFYCLSFPFSFFPCCAGEPRTLPRPRRSLPPLE